MSPLTRLFQWDARRPECQALSGWRSHPEHPKTSTIHACHSLPSSAWKIWEVSRGGGGLRIEPSGYVPVRRLQDHDPFRRLRSLASFSGMREDLSAKPSLDGAPIQSTPRQAPFMLATPSHLVHGSQTPYFRPSMHLASTHLLRPGRYQGCFHLRLPFSFGPSDFACLEVLANWISASSSVALPISLSSTMNFISSKLA